MLFSHCFGSQEKLDRARFWLTWHGFAVQEARPTDAATLSVPRLSVRVNLGTSAAAHALIDSIERMAAPGPRRWVVDQPRIDSVAGTSAPHGTPIHWGPRDAEPGDATASRVAEYMFSRWE